MFNMKSFILTLCFCYSLLVYPQQTVQPFLENVVSLFPNVRDIAFSADKNEVFFSAQSVMGNTSVIVTAIKKNGIWSSPKVVRFSGQYFDIEPFISQDGLTLYFVSNRPMDSNTTDVKDFDIWYTKRISLNDAWSEPINLGDPINSKNDEFYPCITKKGNLYFTMDNPERNQKDDIYVSEFISGEYLTPKPLGDSINSNGYEFNAYISPDESFLIYTCYNREDGFGSGDLYISYHSDEGWSKVKNLGNKINSNKMDYCPFIDTKSNTLYFTSKRDNSKTNFDKPQNLDELLREFNKYDNGSSKLYQVNIEELLTKKL